MMVDDIIHAMPRMPYSLPQSSWLAGAAAGLQILEPRTPRWMWEDFISDVYAMMRLIGDVEPAEPGTAPKYGDGLIGSAYDSLGGYVSVAGEVCPEGLFFKIVLEGHEKSDCISRRNRMSDIDEQFFILLLVIFADSMIIDSSKDFS